MFYLLLVVDVCSSRGDTKILLPLAFVHYTLSPTVKMNGLKHSRVTPGHTTFHIVSCPEWIFAFCLKIDSKRNNCFRSKLCIPNFYLRHQLVLCLHQFVDPVAISSITTTNQSIARTNGRLPFINLPTSFESS